MKIDFKGFILGSLIGTVLLFFAGAIVGFLFVLYLKSVGGLYEVASSNNKSPLIGMIFGLSVASGLACFVSGWLTAKLSKTHRLFTAMAVGILLTCYAFILSQEKGLLLTFLGAVVPIPFSYFGASRFLKRANKNQNNTHRGRTPQKRSPFERRYAYE